MRAANSSTTPSAPTTTPPTQTPSSPAQPPPSSQPPVAASRNPNCPVCNEQFNLIAAPLPIALHSHSCLVCRVTGEIMNEDNPPMVLPNGFVYSKNAVTMISAKNGGKMVCPVTGLVCKVEELRKAFIS